jgi:hypothetical protein
MRPFVWSTAAAFAAAAAGFADDPPKKADPPAVEKKAEKKADDDRSPMEKFKDAKKELDAKEKAFQAVINAMREKGEKLTLQNKELNEAYVATNKAREAAQKVALAAGKSDPKSKDGADALFFAAQGLMGSPDGEAVMDLLLEHHLNDVRIGQQIGGLMYDRPTPANLKLLEKVESTAKNKDTVGIAKLARGVLMLREKNDDAKARGVAMLETVAAEYKDVKLYNRPIGPMAEGNIFEHKFLSEGKVVPEIEGEDVDEAKFKLSDYRGKVVMLDFWGHW